MLARSLRISTSLVYFVAPVFVCLNSAFWFGNSNYSFGVCLFLLWVSLLISNIETQTTNVFKLAAVLVVFYFCHMIVCASAVLVLFLFVLQTRRIRLLAAIVPTIALVLWYKFALISTRVVMQRTGELPARYGSVMFLVSKANTYLRTLGCTNVLDVSRKHSVTLAILGRYGFLLMILLSVILGVVVLVLLVHAIYKNTPLSGSLRFVWSTVLLMGLISLLLPSFLLGVYNPGYRMLQLAVAVIPFLILQQQGRFAHAAGAVVAVLVVFSALLNLSQFVVIQHQPDKAGTLDNRIPVCIVLQVAVVNPQVRMNFYQSLDRNEMDDGIFNTALYSQSTTQ